MLIAGNMLFTKQQCLKIGEAPGLLRIKIIRPSHK